MRKGKDIMGLLSAFKEQLPASKRAVHELRDKVNRLTGTVDALSGSVAALSGQIEALHRELAATHLQIETNAQQRTDQTLQAIRTHDAQMHVFAWTSFKKSGESDEESRRRFFLSMPKAQGDLRLLQRGCAQLMKEFSQLCDRHHIRYWADFGTLLGAVRHHGFIPWDDDTDFGMIREDIDQLRRIVAEDPAYAHRYLVRLVYDPYAFCRQVRFMYNDPDNPAFLDLFIYDFTPDSSPETYARRTVLRDRMIDELQGLAFYDEWKETGYITPDHRFAPQLEDIFERYHRQSLRDGITCVEEQAAGVMFSYDDCTLDKLVRIYPLNRILPTSTASFEDMTIATPHDPMLVLGTDYGAIYDLPGDIVSHFDHVSRDLFTSRPVLNALTHSIEAPDSYLRN